MASTPWGPSLSEHALTQTGLWLMEVFKWINAPPPSRLLSQSALPYFLSPSFQTAPQPSSLLLVSILPPLLFCFPCDAPWICPPGQFGSDLNWFCFFSHERHTNHHRKIISLQESTMTSQYKHGKKHTRTHKKIIIQQYGHWLWAYFYIANN